MGVRIAQGISSFVNGVSQQSPALRRESQVEEMINCLPSIAKGVRRRPSLWAGAKILDGQVGSCYTYVINRDQSERYILVITNGDLKVFDLNGDEKTVYFPHGKDYLIAEDPAKTFKATTIADYTFIVNKNKKVMMSDSLTESRPCEAVIWVENPFRNSDYTVYINGSTINTYTTGDYPDANDIIASMITALGGLTGFTIKYDGSSTNSNYVYIRKTDGSDFTIEVTDGSTRSFKLLKREVQDFNDLPPVCMDGYVVHVVPSPDNADETAGYWMKFVCESGAGKMGKGYWVETVAPNTAYQFYTSTMPHGLVREADGTFTFKQLEWGGRKVGDQDTAPDPSFVGKTIEAICFAFNRLVFLSDDNVIMSRAHEYFEFFPSTVMTLLDSDPIDLNANNEQVSKMLHAEVLNENLILFSPIAQFVFTTDNYASPSSSDIKRISKYPVDTSVPLTSNGKNIYFSYSDGNTASIYEYYVDVETGIKDAVNVTAHIPTYLGLKPKQISVSTTSDILTVLCEDTPNTLYVYKFFWNGKEKVQSAWSKWEFNNVEILSAEFLEDYLFLILQYPDGVYLGKMIVKEDYRDTGFPIDFALDRKISEKECTVFYDPSFDKTIIQLPYTLPEGVSPVLITRDGETDVAEEFIPTIESSNTLSLLGDWSGASFYIGEYFNSYFKLSPIYFRETSTGEPILTGRLQLQKIKLSVQDTGGFEITIAPKYRNTSIKSFNFTSNNYRLGDETAVIGCVALYTKELSFPVYTESTKVDITISSLKFLPFSIIKAEWAGLYTTKHRRY